MIWFGWKSSHINFWSYWKVTLHCKQSCTKHWGHSLMRGVGRWRWVTLHTLLQRLIPGVSSFYTENNHTMCNFDFNNYFYNLAFQLNTKMYLKAEMNDKVCGTFLQLHLASFSLFFLANRSMQVHISTCRTKRTLTRVSEIYRERSFIYHSVFFFRWQLHHILLSLTIGPLSLPYFLSSAEW